MNIGLMIIGVGLSSLRIWLASQKKTMNPKTYKKWSAFAAAVQTGIDELASPEEAAHIKAATARVKPKK